MQIDAPLVPYYKDVISAASLSPTLLQERDSVVETLCEKLASKDPSIFEIGCFTVNISAIWLVMAIARCRN